MYGFIPANQFNVDLFLDTISVLNRTTKDGFTHSFYELYSLGSRSTTIATSDAAGES